MLSLYAIAWRHPDFAAFLRLNYTSAVTIGADADNTALVALYRLPQTSTEEEALTGFELFISNVKQLKEHYA